MLFGSIGSGLSKWSPCGSSLEVSDISDVGKLCWQELTWFLFYWACQHFQYLKLGFCRMQNPSLEKDGKLKLCGVRHVKMQELTNSWLQYFCTENFQCRWKEISSFFSQIILPFKCWMPKYDITNSSVNELHVLLIYLEIWSGTVWLTCSLQSNTILQL